jgi:hypothetical protein
MKKGANRPILKIINTKPKKKIRNYSFDIFVLSFYFFCKKKWENLIRKIPPFLCIHNVCFTNEWCWLICVEYVCLSYGKNDDQWWSTNHLNCFTKQYLLHAKAKTRFTKPRLFDAASSTINYIFQIKHHRI